MNNKNKLASLIILLIIIGIGVVLFFSYKENKMNKLSGLLNQIDIKDETIADNTKPFKINITYPQVEGLEEFNKLSKDIVNQELDNFRKNSLENDNAVQETNPSGYSAYPREYVLNISYNRGDDLNNNIISIVFNIYSFEGGAHGASYFIPLNYNTRTKKIVNLSDLFPNQPDYIKKISDFCITDLTNQITKSLGDTSGTWIEEGASPLEENFSIFLINKKNLIFYFSQYQVAYGAAGDFKVIYPR